MQTLQNFDGINFSTVFLGPTFVHDPPSRLGLLLVLARETVEFRVILS